MKIECLKNFLQICYISPSGIRVDGKNKDFSKIKFYHQNLTEFVKIIGNFDYFFTSWFTNHVFGNK